MSAEGNSIAEHMNQLRMKLVQKKIANEKDRLMNRPASEESTSNDLENQARLQQAMLRRQELLDKIRREQLLNEETKRPRSYSERRRYTPSPLHAPPSRRSLPDFTRYNYYNTGAETNRSKGGVSQVKHVIEHKIRTPPPPQRLPPINHPSPRILPPPPPPGVIIQPPPPPQIMHQPAPQIIQSPPQHVIQQIPQPIVQNLTGQPQENKSMFNKADFGEMMMMQNAQMHQMVMQKLMIGNLAHPHDHCRDPCTCQDSCTCGGHGHGNCNCHGAPWYGCNPCYPGYPGWGGGWGGWGCYPGWGGGYDCLPVPRTSGAVHHHHYTSPPPSQPPAVHHYNPMPSMEIRGGALRGEFLNGGYVPEEYTTYQPYYEYYQ